MANGDRLEYMVEQILNKRVRRGVVQYLIKWKDCEPSENTWEAEENITCGELLRKFLEEEASKPINRERKFEATTTGDGGKVYVSKENRTEKLEKKDDQQGNRKEITMKKPTRKSDDPLKKQSDGDNSNGFERGCILDSLVGITDEGGKLFFVVKWQAKEKLEMVASTEVRKYVPEMVIDFYENRIMWNTKKGAKKQRL